MPNPIKENVPEPKKCKWQQLITTVERLCMYVTEFANKFLSWPVLSSELLESV